MAGITTSETMAGEQPKDDDQRLGLTQTMNRVGGRLAELTVEMRQTKSKSEELNRTFLALTADVEELQKEYTDLSESLHQLDHGR
jgi:predicted  nucleic acid-binding Zn-ribbon protein